MRSAAGCGVGWLRAWAGCGMGLCMVVGRACCGLSWLRFPLLQCRFG